MFGIRGIGATYLNGAEFVDGIIKPRYTYKGYATKGDPEYTIQLYCNELKESLYAMFPAPNSSIQLCRYIHFNVR